MTTDGPRTDAGTNLALAGMGSLFGLGTLLWAGGVCSALVCSHRVPHGRLLAGYAAFAHAGEPSAAWHAPVGPAVVYWPVTVLVLTTAGALGVLGWRIVHAGPTRQHSDPARVAGLATRSQVKAAAGQRALLRRARTLRPSLAKPAPSDVGYRLGHARGIACWVSVEDSMVLLGPPRSGKGLHTVIDAILDAPGAVVTTSTRPDNLTATLQARQAAGPVAVFDPQHLARGVPSAVKWSPVRGCEDPQTAMIRARALCADPAEGVEGAAFWAQQCYTAVRCLLHAAALAHRPTVELYQWSLAPVAAKEAAEILKAHPASAPAWSRALEAILSADPRQRDSVWAMVANTFAPLADPDVLATLSPAAGEQFDPETFLRGAGAVYLLGTASGASATAGLVAAFVEDVVEAARRLAAASPGARLDPPLAVILDEAANYPLPSLPALMSEGGGTGITTLVVLQSLAQARARWGHDGAAAIWDAAIVKLILGGGGNADDLRDLSALIGTRVEHKRSTSTGGPYGRTFNDTTEEKPILDPGQLRTLPFGSGLLLLRSAPPILTRLTAWTDRPDATALRASKAELEAAIHTAHTADAGRRRA
ncbi:TraM recognition domain-containing protein [Jatrophihabitans cynanchi]|uniref:TraM recognition domain-containing protein n=1 Tax=Jatrophihabitans cynanchi TaxID=2944128 RepID=A0ABY7JVD0_9ACTN|nr:TraM recognition domain-containing protein [Jatrophihabitans sp. SB3-54]WAX55139.1 TraM recognition domain-containing protein [Jatrophihabitans sp. SB3-54]